MMSGDRDAAKYRIFAHEQRIIAIRDDLLRMQVSLKELEGARLNPKP